MNRGNVLVIGNSGVGKSTLINAVLGEEKALTGYGTTGTTDKLEIYESEKLPFRVIDTIGFEPTFMKEQMAINAVKKWSKNSAKEGMEDTQINVIWFCVDGTSRKLFKNQFKVSQELLQYGKRFQLLLLLPNRIRYQSGKKILKWYKMHLPHKRSTLKI